KHEFKELEPIINRYRNTPGNLIPVLHEVQDLVGYLPFDVQDYVARELGISLSKVYGVVTFYSFFSIMPKGDHTIGVCMGTACYVKGAEDIVAKVKNELRVDEVGDTSDDKRFTLTITRCLGTCSMAPVMMIDDKVYGKLTPESIPEILEKY
ncbi:MAG TPA: NADH-quinone oxidoreductase subunit NuoE, partial [Bacteroidales bacterium]|nr:NADH-quinone oxidoreductase subunit NuoE [Bacteroidales bacterium]